MLAARDRESARIGVEPRLRGRVGVGAAARAIARDLNGTEEEPGPARENRTLPPEPTSILRYRVRSENGTVAFSDSSRGQPQAFYEVAKLTRDLAKRVCGLAR